MRENKNYISDHRMELLERLDDLDPEELAPLVSGINKVGLSYDEQMSLKSKIMARAGIEFDSESEPELGNVTEAGGRTVSIKNRKHMRRAVICIASVMACFLVAFAAANMDALQRYWGDDKELYSGSFSGTAQSVQDENVKMNIEGVVSDKYQCVFVLSVEALTDEGRKMIEQNTGKHDFLGLEMKPTVIDGAEDHCATGIFQYTDDNKNKDYKAYECSFELDQIDLTQPVTVEYVGLTMNFDIPEPMQIITLYPDAEASIESAELSPIGYYYKVADIDTDFAEVRLIKKDGTLEEEMGYHGGMHREEDPEEVMVIGSFTRLIDLNDYPGIQLDGINYTPKQMNP